VHISGLHSTEDCTTNGRVPRTVRVHSCSCGGDYTNLISALEISGYLYLISHFLMLMETFLFDTFRLYKMGGYCTAPGGISTSILTFISFHFILECYLQ